jgi:transcriptional regulator with XRE-family HTH domain
MDKLLSELRAILAATGIRQTAVAARLGMQKSRLSKILNGDQRMPGDFEARFRAAVAALAVEAGQRERAAAEARARAIESAAGVRVSTSRSRPRAAIAR